MRWPHYEHVFFDCDSTLTTVEGIDVLAETAGKKWRIEVLTNAAMDGHLDLGDVYAKRLQAVRPTRQQIQTIRQVYKRNAVPEAASLIEALHELGHKVYIISGGLAEPVAEFGIHLGVPRERIRAVGVNYNQLSGDWWNRNSPHQRGQDRYLMYEEGSLTVSDGKANIVKELMGNQKGRAILIGDGSSDLLASRALDLFVGYGGVVARERVAREAPSFIHSLSLAPMLALAAGPSVLPKLYGTKHETLADKANTLIQEGKVTFNDERLNQKFQKAYQAVYPRTH